MVDERCCGTGTCIINAEGLCWCGQKWNGNAMCFPESEPRHESAVAHASVSPTTTRAPQPSSPHQPPEG